MVGHPFRVVGAVHQKGDERGLRVGETPPGQLDQIRGEVGLHPVDAAFGFGQLFVFRFVPVPGEKVFIHRAVDHLPAVLHHHFERVG